MTSRQTDIILKAKAALGYAKAAKSRQCEERLDELIPMLKEEFSDE